MMSKYKQTRLFQETFKVKQPEIASRLIQGQATKIKRISLVDQLLPLTHCFQQIKALLIDYQEV